MMEINNILLPKEISELINAFSKFTIEDPKCTDKKFKLSLNDPHAMVPIKNMLLEVLSQDYITTTCGKDVFLLKRLDNVIVISQHDGDLLFIDPENAFSVWLWWHDGGDCQKLSNNIFDWLDSCKQHKEIKPIATADEYLHIQHEMSGNWIGDYNTYYCLENDGTVTKYFSDGIISDGHWRIIEENKISFLMKHELVFSIVRREKNEILIELDQSVRKHQIVLKRIDEDKDFSLYHFLYEFLKEEMNRSSMVLTRHRIIETKKMENGDTQITLWRFAEKAKGQYSNPHDVYRYVFRKKENFWEVISKLEIEPMSA